MKVLSVVGNRPQFIKSGPLSVALREAGIQEVVLHTGQHYDRELSDVFFEELGLAEPAYRLEAHTRDVDAMLPGIQDALERERPDAALVFGDTNSTLAGARAARHAGVPFAHVEAGMRSGDMTMPEEHTRIEVDSIADLLLCPDERSRGILESEGVPGRIEVVGDVMADACFTFAPIARERSDVLERLGLQPGTYVVATIHRDANVVEPRLGRIVAGLDAIEEPVIFPAHPRTRDALLSQGLSPGHVRLVEPLAYLDFAALASQARVIVTDSGGLQKEAYWYGVPCVTARPSTEWVDTVEQGANTLVDDDPEQLVAAVAAARPLPEGPACVVRRRQGSAEDRRSSLYPFRPMTEPKLEAQPAEPATRHWDVAVVGAGYVGVPLARLLAQSGKTVLLVDVAEHIVAGINRGESHIEDVPSEELGPLVSEGRIAATSDYDALRDADAIVVALPTPLSKQREPDISILLDAVNGDRRSAAPGPPRRARVDDVPRHDPRGRPAALSAGGLEVGRDFHLAFSPERVDPGNTPLAPGERAEDRRWSHRRLHRAGGRALPGRDRPGTPRLVAGGRRADEAAREHLPLGQHRARQRARPALRPDGHRRLGGRRRGVHEAVRLHALRARPRASAATASRSTPSTSRGRRGSTASTPSSSSSPARSTRTCPTTAAR